jgi:hypothetical protein
MTARDIITSAQAIGAELWADGATLRWRCPGGLPEELKAVLVAHKPQLLALLSSAPALSSEDHEAIEEAIEERAAIREHDGGESRETAEREARSAMRVYRYRVTDKPDTWLTMIAPGCDLADAQHTLELRFPGRLLEVQEHIWRTRT